MNFTWVSNLCNDFWLVQAPRAAAAVFIIFNLVAMQLYPGGTIHNPHSANYHLTQNYFSDLGRAVAYNGVQNFHSSLIFNLTLLITGITFSIFYFTKLWFALTYCFTNFFYYLFNFYWFPRCNIVNFTFRFFY